MLPAPAGSGRGTRTPNRSVGLPPRPKLRPLTANPFQTYREALLSSNSRAPCTNFAVFVIAEGSRHGRLLPIPAEPPGREPRLGRLCVAASQRASATAPLYHRLRSCTNIVIDYHHPARRRAAGLCFHHGTSLGPWKGVAGRWPWLPWLGPRSPLCSLLRFQKRPADVLCDRLFIKFNWYASFAGFFVGQWRPLPGCRGFGVWTC